MPFICVVCRDKLTLQENGEIQIIVASECGHLFHQKCLAAHFEKGTELNFELTGKLVPNSKCPTCMRVINAANNRQIFAAEIEDSKDEVDLKHKNGMLLEENLCLKGKVRNMQMRLEASEKHKRSPIEVDSADFVLPRFNINPTIQPFGATESGLKIGDEVVWFGGGGDTHDGTVKWIGKINSDMYAGIEFIDQIGNGFPESGGRAIFNCPPNAGRLIRPRELLLRQDFYG